MNSLVRRRSGFPMKMLRVFRDEGSQTENFLQSERAASPNISNKDHQICELQRKICTPSYGKETDAKNFRRHFSCDYETVDHIDRGKPLKPSMHHVTRTRVENPRQSYLGRSIDCHRRNSPGHMDATVDNRPDLQPQQVSLPSSQI